MTWIALSLALAGTALTYKWLRAKNALDKASRLLTIERKKTTDLAEANKDITVRSNERIKNLKRKMNALLEQNVENSGPGDLLDALNGLHKDGDR